MIAEFSLEARMSIELAGGCSVSLLREGDFSQSGTAREWPRIGRSSGATAISLRTLQTGVEPFTVGGANCDEVVYVVDGVGSLLYDGKVWALGPDTGFYVPPGTQFELTGAMTLVSSRCPEPSAGPAVIADSLSAPAVVRLVDCLSETTGDRWYKVLLDGKVGTQVTQFVGAIPPGRAPDHFHEYEEVLCILSGEGHMWGGDKSTPISAGSCIYLPRRAMHCVENTGSSELRLLGVFYPSGSPAVRYYK
jgi:mannose-6-phosphate isomerase-like protein (cupin superfamily)